MKFLNLHGFGPSKVRQRNSQRGALLIETVVSLIVFGLVGTAVLSAVQISASSKNQFQIQSEAELMVRRQLGAVHEQAYLFPPDTYVSIPPSQAYTVTAESVVWDVSSPDISTLRITVYHSGQEVRVFETLRSNW